MTLRGSKDDEMWLVLNMASLLKAIQVCRGSVPRLLVLIHKIYVAVSSSQIYSTDESIETLRL